MEAGLFVGGFLLVGMGTAQADDGGMAPPANQSLLTPVTQVLDGSGALGSLTSTLTGLTGSTTGPTPAPSTPTMNSTTTTTSTTVAPTSQSAPAPTAEHTTTAPQPVQTAAPLTSGSSATTSTAGTTTDAGCACVVSTGTPTVNGKAAGAKGTATAPVGQPAAIGVPVSNTGKSTVTGLAATGPNGDLSCSSTTLAPGSATSCTGSYTPAAGDQSVPITVAGTTSDGGSATSTGLLFVTGLVGAGTQTSGSTSGSTMPSGSTSGTNGEPVDTTGGTSPVADDTSSEPCHCVLTTGTPTVAGKAAGSPGKAVLPVGTPGSLTVLVSNTGAKPVTELSATSTEGPLTCASSELAPAESTSCTGSLNPKEGDQVVPIQVSGKTPDGSTTWTEGAAFVTGTPAGTTPGSTDGTTEPGTTDGTDGSTDTSSTDQALRISEPTVDDVPAGEPGSAKAEAHKPAAVTFVVSNNTDDEVQGLTGRVGSRGVTCTDTELAPGETATCRGRLFPQVGEQAAPITMSGTLADGRTTQASRSVYLGGLAPVQAAPADSGAGSVDIPDEVGQATESNGGVAGSGDVLGGVPAPSVVQQFVDPSRGAFPIPLGAVSAGGGGTAQQVSADNTQPAGSQHNRLAWVLLAAGIGAFGLRRLLPIRSR